MPAPAILERARTLGVDPKAVRAGARNLSRSVSAGAVLGRKGTSRKAAAEGYLSAQLAAASLEDGADDTPMHGDAQNPQELAEALRRANNDAEAFEHFVNDILAGLDTTPQDAEELGRKLKHARHDPEKVMALVREAQKVRQLTGQERRELLERVQNEIREFECSPEGKQVLAEFNAAPEAARTADPGAFLDTYKLLVETERNFTATLKLLLTRHTPTALRDGVANNLKKALADDLGALVPSRDPTWLGAILMNLGHIHIISTLVDSAMELSGLMQRTSDVAA